MRIFRYHKNMAINWTNIFKKHKGEWVGLKSDNKTVIASGKTPQEVLKKAKEKGTQSPGLFKVPEESVPYIGICRG